VVLAVVAIRAGAGGRADAPAHVEPPRRPGTPQPPAPLFPPLRPPAAHSHRRPQPPPPRRLFASGRPPRSSVWRGTPRRPLVLSG